LNKSLLLARHAAASTEANPSNGFLKKNSLGVRIILAFVFHRKRIYGYVRGRAERHVHGVAGRRFSDDKSFSSTNDIGARQ
jgi:hypothetical protein